MKKEYIKPQILITSLRPEERIAGQISDEATGLALGGIQSYFPSGGSTEGNPGGTTGDL